MKDKIIQIIAVPAEEPKYDGEVTLYGLSESGTLYYMSYDWTAWKPYIDSPEIKKEEK